MTDTYAALPWRLDENVPGHPTILDSNGVAFAEAETHTAAYIILACNNYPDLLKALDRKTQESQYVIWLLLGISYPPNSFFW